jgi:AcrR family transcriptional regulator
MATSQPVSSRRTRQRDLVAATRALFDEKGMQDAPIEEIARSVGIARGLVYREFSSKEELYVLTVTEYLTELDGILAASVEGEADHATQLERWADAFARFCLRYPAFLDSSLSLMRGPARGLYDSVSESVWLRLGQGIGSCVSHVSTLLRNGAAAGAFDVDDPDYIANVLWTQMLGVMHLARSKVGVRQAAPGVPELFVIDPERIVRTCVCGALATVGGHPPTMRA